MALHGRAQETVPGESPELTQDTVGRWVAEPRICQDAQAGDEAPAEERMRKGHRL